ncbi:MAG: hypothetical protein V4671_29370, partial [Armatimonadota bacterium]
KLGGGLSVGIQCWESDGESKETRDQMLQKFDSKMTEFFRTDYDKAIAMLPLTISESFSTDWKLEQMEVTAFTRGGGMQKFGTLYNATPNQWIKARESASFAMAGSGTFRELGITSEDLLKVPTTGPITAQRQGVPQDLSAWAGEWETTLGSINLSKVSSDKLTGTVMRSNDTGIVREGEAVELTFGGREGQTYGRWSIGGGYARSGNLTWDIAADKNSFKGTYDVDGQPAPLTPYEWSGKRKIGANAPASKYDLTKWVGDWYTDTGKLSLKQSTSGLQGTLYYLRRDQYSIEGGTIQLAAGDRPGQIKGQFDIDPGDGSRKRGAVEIFLSEDSSAFLATLQDGTSPMPYEWVGSRIKRAAAAKADLARWAGDWKSGNLELTFQVGSDGALHGRPRGAAGNSADVMILLPGPNLGSTLGRYVAGDGKTRDGFLEWDLASDSSRFNGTITGRATSTPVVAVGNRIGATPAPTSTANSGGVTGSPIVGSGSGSTGNTGNTGVVPPAGGSASPVVTASAGDLLGDGQFRHLTNVDVRLDKLSPGRGGTVQAFFTFKNTSSRQTRLMGGSLDLWLFDADGIGWSDTGTLYRPGGTTLENAGILDFEPGDEVKIRYVWKAPGGLRALKSLRVQDRSQFEKLPVTWDLQSYLPKGAVESAMPSGLFTAGDGDFAEMGDWDIRLDGVKRTGTKVELFFTFRNPDAKPRVFSGGFRSTLTDTDGATAYTTGQFFRVGGDREEFGTSLVAAPNGGEARVSYYVTLPSPNSGPNKLTVNWGNDKKTYDLSGIR